MLLLGCLRFTKRGWPFVFAPKKRPDSQTTSNFALVCLWCRRAVYGHVITKFTYPWCSTGALRAPELRYHFDGVTGYFPLHPLPLSIPTDVNLVKLSRVLTIGSVNTRVFCALSASTHPKRGNLIYPMMHRFIPYYQASQRT